MGKFQNPDPNAMYSIWVHNTVFTVYSTIVAIILPPTLNVFIYFLLFCLLVKKKHKPKCSTEGH